MRKLLYTLSLLGSLAVYGQSDIFVNVGSGQAKEFIGDDVKHGTMTQLGVNLDLFGKKKFDFGASIATTLMGDLSSDIELLQAEQIGMAGLFVGFNNDNMALKAKYLLPVLDEDPIFKSAVSGVLTLKAGKKRNFGFNFGVDYYFNRHIFHYTYSLNTGITFKL